SLGIALDGQLSPGNEVNAYRFSGQAGQRMDIERLAAPSSAASWRLVGTRGQTLLSGGINASLGQITPPATGSYQILVEGDGPAAATLTFQIRVSDVSDTPVAVSGLGVLSTGTIAAGEQKSFTFDAPAGRRLSLDSQDRDFDDVVIDLRAPQGTLV